MALELETFASGDTDYISKLNSNVSDIEDAINALQTQIEAVGGGGSLSAGMFLGSLFNSRDALIGPNSYKPTKSSTTITVDPGGMYLQSVATVVASFVPVTLNFVGQSPAMQYLVVSTSGLPMRMTEQAPGTIYSVYWNGSSLGELIPIARVFYDTDEANASRYSAASATPEQRFTTLDGRLEQVETTAIDAKESADAAVEIAYELQAAVGTRERKIGITVDGAVGVKGAIQIDFNGVISGWSIIANQAGDIQVAVSVKPSSAPPAVPAIPNPATDKISASAPIQLVSAQSAAQSSSGVSTWTRGLEKWDVVQFEVVSVSTLTQATLYVRIDEIMPSPPVINPLESPDDLEFREEGDQ